MWIRYLRFLWILERGCLLLVKIEKKKKIVEDLKEKFATTKVVIVTDYKGLNVAQMTELRRKLSDADVEYQVVKNTLLTRASKDTDAELLNDVFKGPSGIALSFDDPVAPAKVLTQFAKDNQKLEIKAGVMNGKTDGFGCDNGVVQVAVQRRASGTGAVCYERCTDRTCPGFSGCSQTDGQCA